MNNIDKEIVDRVADLYIDCPACEFIEDPQYTCMYCWNTGGNGRLNVLEFLRDNPQLLPIGCDGGDE
jgi:hypothetical protein